MTSKFARFLMSTVFAVSVAAMAQTAALPAAPSAAASNADAPPAAISATGTRTGTVNVEQAIFATNEGQRDFEALSKKLEPKQTELKGQNDEVESLKKQLNTQGEKLNDESRATLVKQIEQKQKSLERSGTGRARRCPEPAERDRAAHSAEAGAHAGEVRRGKRFRRDHRHFAIRGRTDRCFGPGLPWTSRGQSLSSTTHSPECPRPRQARRSEASCASNQAGDYCSNKPATTAPKAPATQPK